VGPVVGPESRHRVAVGTLPVYLRAEIRKGGAQHLVEAAHAFLVGATIRLRRVIDEIVGEQLVEHIETPVDLNLFGISRTTALAASLRDRRILTDMRRSAGLRFRLWSARSLACLARHRKDGRR
jgi:hypothetical protein